MESSIADEYALVRISVLNCSYTVGQEYEASDGTKKKYTESEVLEKMLTDAKEKFTKDHVDGVDITLEVEFLLLGDTEEYRQYRDLQWVSLYDDVKVKTGKSMINASAYVTEYEYDSLRKRYNSIKLGTVNSFNKRIAGYRFINGSITYDKLSSDLIDRIVTANASSTTDSGSAGDLPGGGGEDVKVEVVDNLTSTDTDKALSANQGKVLNEKIPSVVDNLTSTSATSALSAKQGKVLNDKTCLKSGQTVTLSGVIATGFISNSTKTITVILPLSVNVNEISTVVVDSMKGVFRGGSGYVDSITNQSTQWVGMSGITISPSKRDYVGVFLNITKSSAFTNVSNNTPISAYFTELKLTFS